MNQRNIGFRIFRVFNIAALSMFGLFTAYPFLNTLAMALNDGTDTVRGGITIFPRVFTVSNFTMLLSDRGIRSAAVVTVSRVVLGTLLALLVQFGAAYAFAKKDLKFRSALTIFLLIPGFISGGIVPVFILYKNLGLLNNFWVYVLPGAFSLYNMVIIRTYMYTIPVELEESAKIDGANEIRIFFRIIIPLCMPIIATIILWTAVGLWNDWTTTLYFITKSSLYTLQFILEQVIKSSEKYAQMIQDAIRAGNGTVYNLKLKITPESVRSAQVILTTLPIILLYPFLQKYFIKGIMIGAIKD